MIAIAIVITCLLYWFTDTAIDCFVLKQGSFADLLLRPDAMVLGVRILGMIIFILLVVLFQLIFRYRRNRKRTKGGFEYDSVSFDLVDTSLFICDSAGRIVTVNDRAAIESGWEKKKLEGEYFWELLSSADSAVYLKESFSNLSCKLFPKQFQAPLTCSDNVSKFMHFNCRLICDGKDIPKAVIISGTDITRYCQLQEMLSKWDDLYRHIADTIGIGICLLSNEGKRLYVNKQIDKWFEFTEATQEPVAHSLSSNFEGYRCGRCPACETLTDKKVHSTTIKATRKEKPITYKITAFPIQEKKDGEFAVIEMVEDITVLDKQAGDLRRNYLVQAVMNSLLRFSLENMSLRVFLDCSLNIILTTPWFSSLSMGGIYLAGDDPDELLLFVQKRIPQDFLDEVGRVPLGECGCGRAASDAKIEFVSGDDKKSEQEPSHYGHYCVPLIYSGKTLGVLDVYLENNHPYHKREEDFLKASANTLAGVIQRKRSEEQVARINEGFIKLGVDPFENIQRLVVLCGLVLGAGFVLYKRELSKDAFYSAGQYNASPDDFERIKPYEVLCIEEVKRNKEEIFIFKDLSQHPRLKQLLKSKEPPFLSGIGKGVAFQDTVAGVLCVFFRNQSPVADDQKKIIGIIASAIGIEEDRIRASYKLKEAYEKLKKAQHGLVQSEKMAALGRFSSGIAHEVKNPLGIILGGIEYLQQKFKTADKDVQIAVGKIKEATIRADHIVRSLLRFATPSELKTEKVSVHELLLDTIAFFKYRAALDNISIKTDFGKEAVYIQADKNQLQQVFFNLLGNANEAIKEKGQITVRAAKTEKPAAIGDEWGVTIDIIDTGEGINKSDLEKLFEPFFTTKRDSKGTGLGLSISRMIIENHKGAINISSEPGKGTCVSVVFPLAV